MFMSIIDRRYKVLGKFCRSHITLPNKIRVSRKVEEVDERFPHYHQSKKFLFGTTKRLTTSNIFITIYYNINMLYDNFLSFSIFKDLKCSNSSCSKLLICMTNFDTHTKIKRKTISKKWFEFLGNFPNRCCKPFWKDTFFVHPHNICSPI